MLQRMKTELSSDDPSHCSDHKPIIPSPPTPPPQPVIAIPMQLYHHSSVLYEVMHVHIVFAALRPTIGQTDRPMTYSRLLSFRCSVAAAACIDSIAAGP